MTGPLPKADALLAARLAPWPELSARKAPAGAEEAPPVSRSPRVDNEVLLPARTSPHSHGTELLRGASPGAGAPQADVGGTGIALSSAARAIFALASGVRAGQAGAVRGSGALWPAAGQPPVTQALASALARQVSESGLFYESHLAEFAGGMRSLAQMQREPQAGLSSAAAVAQAAQDADAAEPRQHRSEAGVLSVAAAQASTGAVPAARASAVAALMPQTPAPSNMPQAQDERALGAEQAGPAPAPPRSAASVPVEYALSQFGQANADAQPRHADADAGVAPDSAVPLEAGDALPTPAAAIHPQAAALVQQQLDLLASSMLRWSGEAWPGAAMAWTVQEEGARQQADETAHESPPCWSTTLTLDLPRMGFVKVDLKLNGANVHAQLAAARAPTLDRLRTREEALARRMSDAGLRLQELEMGPEVAAP